MWAEQDLWMKRLKKKYQAETKITKTRLQEKFNLLSIDELNTLNSIASTEQKQRCNNFIDIWRRQGLCKGYFGMRCNDIYRRKRVRNNDILELYIYYCFIMYEDAVAEEEQEAFRHLTNYYYRVGMQEVGAKPTDMPDSLYNELINTPCTNGYTYDEYKQAKALTSAQQIHRQAVSQIQQGKKPNVNEMDKELEKQGNERLKVGDKISGVIDMILIGLNLLAKLDGIKKATKREDTQVRFVAVMDDRTTPMCKSLDGQVFNVYKDNEFTRWDDSTKQMRKYKCHGLVMGLNLPPITNHFHWCRSTIIYNINYPDEVWKDKYIEMKTKNN